MFHIVRLTADGSGTGGVSVIGLSYSREQAEEMRVAMMEFDTYHPEAQP